MTEDAMFFESNRILLSFCYDSPRRFVGCHMRVEDVARVEMSAKCAGIMRKDSRACSMQNQKSCAVASPPECDCFSLTNLAAKSQHRSSLRNL
jgi:hypothetical protein